MTCAAPVLPETSRPSTRPRPPAPAAFTTIHNPPARARNLSGLDWVASAAAGGFIVTHPLPSSTALTTRGVTRLPLFATVAIITASDAGVTDTCPWPIATEMVSPGYHGSPVVFFFHSVLGTRLGCSFGRSMPVLPVKPSFSAHL